jgi:hypothetical protein
VKSEKRKVKSLVIMNLSLFVYHLSLKRFSLVLISCCFFDAMSRSSSLLGRFLMSYELIAVSFQQRDVKN